MHGFGGVGKTTIVDAGFACLFDANRKGCRFSFVKLFENRESTPYIYIYIEIVKGKERKNN